MKKSHNSAPGKNKKMALKKTELEKPSVMVLGAYLPAKNSSTDLRDFIDVFEPFARKSNLKLRQKAFRNCDSECSENLKEYCNDKNLNDSFLLI